jgi:hypothetical protein
VECGFTNVVFAESDKDLSTAWEKIARFSPLFLNGSSIEDGKGTQASSGGG